MAKTFKSKILDASEQAKQIFIQCNTSKFRSVAFIHATEVLLIYFETMQTIINNSIEE